MTDGGMIYLGRDAVTRLLDVNGAIDAVRRGFEAVADGRVSSPPRTVIPVPDLGFFGSMPVFAAGFGSAAKVMTIYPDNHGAGLPSHQGHILLFAEADGRPLALIEAGSVTEMRTGAASGLATDLLANPGPADLCLLGSGVQARSHLLAIRAVRPLSRARVWSRTAAHAEAFVQWAGETAGVDVDPCASPGDALEGATVVCTVTASRDPVVGSDAIADGCHVNAVGSFTPTARELDGATVARSRLYVDSKASAERESGDVLLAREEGAIGEDHIVGELHELVTGAVEGRRSTSEVTVFKSLGLAIEDLATAKALYDRAVDEGVGTEIA